MSCFEELLRKKLFLEILALLIKLWNFLIINSKIKIMLKFYKYHGAGNDFIMIDNRDGSFDVHDMEKIKLLCHRRFGIGADGMQIMQNHPTCDFEMIFPNSYGSI